MRVDVNECDWNENEWRGKMKQIKDMREFIIKTKMSEMEKMNWNINITIEKKKTIVWGLRVWWFIEIIRAIVLILNY